MSQYPVQDTAGLYEAVNYLLSGPSGLGQNFNGFSAYQPAWLTGAFRQPFTEAISTGTSAPSWYVAPINISNITRENVVNGNTANLLWTFSTPQATPPFRPGQKITAENVTPDYYDSTYVVLTCSTTTMQTQDQHVYPYPAYVSSGDVYFNNDNTVTSTDANARVTVQGPTELVFISSQCQWNSQIGYSSPSQFDLVVQINRYAGSIDTSVVGAVDYLFNFDATVSQQIHRYNVNTSTNTKSVFDSGSNIFTTVLDQPNFGYYWYICELDVVTAPTYRYDSQGNLVVGSAYNASYNGTGVSLGSTSTFAGVSLVDVASTGSGGTADITIEPGLTNYVQSASVSLNGDGNNYAVGDTLKILGTNLGGASPANDMNLTITQVGYPGDATPYTQTVGLRSLTAQVIKQ